MIRELRHEELQPLLSLYLHLHEERLPDDMERLDEIWQRMERDGNYHIIVAEEDGRIVSSCVLTVIYNLTRGGRPYALIENVVTEPAFRGRGLATACLGYAEKLARRAGCYKIMLMTGSRDPHILDFYRKAGFHSGDKTAFVQWLDLPGSEGLRPRA